MQKQDVDVAKRIEFAASIAPECNQGERLLRSILLRPCGGDRGGEDMPQQDVDQFNAQGANFSSAAASLMLQAQAMFLDLEKLFIEGEDVCRAPRARFC